MEPEGIDAVDFGVYAGETALYPDIASQVASRVAAGGLEHVGLLCGTGIGVAMIANQGTGRAMRSSAVNWKQGLYAETRFVVHVLESPHGAKS